MHKLSLLKTDSCSYCPDQLGPFVGFWKAQMTVIHFSLHLTKVHQTLKMAQDEVFYQLELCGILVTQNLFISLQSCLIL